MVYPRVDVRRILCPTDFSEVAERALEHAVRIASFFEATVHLLHVIPTLSETLDLLTTGRRDGADRPREAARTALDALVAQCVDWHVPIEPVTRVGDPTRVILREAEDLGADLIVMGSRRRSGLDHFVVGSVIERVMRRAGCPVLAIGAHDTSPAAAPPYRRILCPTRLAPESDGTVAFAIALAEENEAEVEILHVIESLPPGLLGGEGTAGVPELAEVRSDLLAAKDDELRRVAPRSERRWCRVRRRMATGDVAAAILDAARSGEADVIVMGARAGAIGRAFFGSTVHRVIQDTTCSVLVVGGAARRPTAEARDREATAAARR